MILIPDTPRNSQTQRGITLIEMLLSISILGLVIAAAATLVDNHLKQTRIAASAQHMKIFGDAVQAYIKDNYLDLTQANMHNVPVATKIIPAVITVNTLRTSPIGLPTGPVSPTRYLPSNYDPVNAYGQTICARVLQPKPNELYALVVTDFIPTPTNKPTPISDLDLGLLAGMIGASGGGIYNQGGAFPKQTAKGTMGKWQFNINTDPVARNFKAGKRCNGNLGPINLQPGTPLMALWFNQDTSSAFLYRDEVPGHPELNTMQHDLRFRPDSTTAPGATLTLSVIREPDTLCDTTPTSWKNTNPDPVTGEMALVPPGTLARDKNGNLMMCSKYAIEDGGDGQNYWRTVAKAMNWGDPVDTYQMLPGCSSSQNAYQTRIVKKPSWQPIPSIASIPRAYTCGPGNLGVWKWQPLGVDDRGVLKTDRLKLGTRTEGQFCQDPIGALAQDMDGSLLTCGMNHLWIKAKSIGRYRFRIPPHQFTAPNGSTYDEPSDNGYDKQLDGNGNPTIQDRGIFVGTGFMSPDNKFSGTLYCDNTYYNYYHPNVTCGSGGVVACGDYPKCTRDNAMRRVFSNPSNAPLYLSNTNEPKVVDVTGLKVIDVVRQW